ncbi:MAG: hypothetical protein AAF196_05215 [Planctomycetota bacterium]
MTDASLLRRLEFSDGSPRRATCDGCSWLTEVQVHDVDGTTGEQRSPEGESLLVVLSGTFDLAAGGGGWLRRGIRAEPYEGRAVALFLPSNTPWQAAEGQGRIVVVSSKQPELPEPENKKEELSKKPLLQMAGSGKAFDPATGDWKPKEAFLSSPEALLPRRFVRLDSGTAQAAERLIGLDYKALSLRADEVGLRDGERAALPALEQPVTEELYFVQTDGEFELGSQTTRQGFDAFVGPAGLPIGHASSGRAYVLRIGAGPKFD